MHVNSIKMVRQGRVSLQQGLLKKLNVWPALATSVGLLAIFVGLLAVIQFATPNLAGNDGYYHVKLAQVMRQQGLRPSFVWLPLTILSPNAFYDHHFLYHVLLMPFTLGDLRLGAKWASVIFPALTFLAGWILLRGQRVPYSAVWAVGFVAVSTAFLYRMSMPRVQALSLLVLLLALHLAFTGRYRWLAPLSFVYVWLYDAFPLVVVVIGIYSAMRWLIDRRFEAAPLGFTALGVTLGLIINPYFPGNLVFIYHHLAPKLADATATRVGNEWYPYRTWTLVENSAGALLVFGAGLFALGLSERRMSSVTATMLALGLLFGLMLFKSRRFVEYFPAFALLFGALAWSPLLASWTRPGHRAGRIGPAVLVLLLLPGLWWSVRGAQDSIERSKSAGLYAGAAAWLQDNTPAGSRVFQTDWDDFTRLFFYNTHNTYTAGLDPTYLQHADPQLYKTWVDITRGRVESPSNIIQDKFGARTIVSDLKHKKFIQQAKKDPRLVETYRDEEAVIFQIVSPASGPSTPPNSGGEPMNP